MKSDLKEILISFLWSTEFKVAVCVMFATGFGYIGGISGNAYTGQNNIQAAHNTVEWEKEDGTVTVSDVNRTLTTQGSSMRPTFFTGNTILTREYTGQELEEGDIITYRQDGRLETHRIQGNYGHTENPYFRVIGDANQLSEKVKPRQIENIVVGVLYTHR